ncbi:hypothetical protein OQZ29_22030 [Pedobacter agri]|uniref:Uncharacterized protein n=1 Tax=Pedobacter agri TaxID=454586 RepID=A0A9X3DHR4_9SPHI|nr:hypothetical protein [Pedobacter agri]MCX3267455.1 hypothetical protein [Pedobacter agri]
MQLKNTSKLFLTLLFVVSLTYMSCKKTEKTVTTIESLKSDERFIAIVKQNASLIANGSNGKEAVSLITKPNPTAAELNKFSTLLGFKDFAEYSDFVQKQDAVLLKLKEEYQLEKVSQKDLTTIGIEVLNSTKHHLRLAV